MAKGRVYPSSPPLPSPSTSPSFYKDPDSVLKLLPVTILALALSLPRQDLEVLAYLLARSVVSTNLNPCHRTKCRAVPTKRNSKNLQTVAKAPVFECGCFDCYTSFWYRWDSSPNRDLIHHVIEAFEEHLVVNESCKRHKGKRRANVMSSGCEQDVPVLVKTDKVQEIDIMLMPEEAHSVGSGDVEDNVVVLTEGDEVKAVEVNVNGASTVHPGLAVLRDLVGLFNARLWSLWSLDT